MAAEKWTNKTNTKNSMANFIQYCNFVTKADIILCWKLIFMSHAFEMYVHNSVVISRPWSRDSGAREFILSRSRSRSRDLMTKVSVLVSIPKKGLDSNTGS